MSLPLSRCLVLPNRLLTFGYGQYSLEVDMGFPATKSSVSQIIEKLDSLPNSARDTAVNNSIVPSDNLAGLGESVLKLYSESSPSAREAIAEILPMRAQSPVSKLSAKLSPAHGMRKLRRKTSIRNRSTIFANEQALPSMTRWMILARLGAARISISSQRPAGECCSPIAR